MTRLRIGIIHPDLGIGGAERLVVDAALGLQKAGHEVEIFTSHHDPEHCFEETRDGTLSVQHIKSPFPRAILGRLHIIFANLSQLHLTYNILSGVRSDEGPKPCDVYIVDQLSTCIPIVRFGIGRRVVYYCHFPDKLLADGKAAPSDGQARGSLLKKLYRIPADWLEEYTTSKADVILANSKFTAGIFNKAFPSIKISPRVVYPGINIDAYQEHVVESESQMGPIHEVISYPTLLSLNRFEGKKNLAIAIETFAKVRRELASEDPHKWALPLRLILGGGFDPRVTDNVQTLTQLLELCATLGLSTFISSTTPLPSSLSHLHEFETQTHSHPSSNVTFLLNFSQTQRAALLQSKNTVALLYTPTNEHFGIGPVEGMICGLPVVACENGGPTETIIPFPASETADIAALVPKPTGFLAAPTSEAFSASVLQIIRFSPSQRAELSEAARTRAREHFGMNAMSASLEEVLLEAVKKGNMYGFMWPRPVSERTHFIIQLVLGGLAVLGVLLVYLGWV